MSLYRWTQICFVLVGITVVLLLTGFDFPWPLQPSLGKGLFLLGAWGAWLRYCA